MYVSWPLTHPLNPVLFSLIFYNFFLSYAQSNIKALFLVVTAIFDWFHMMRFWSSFLFFNFNSSINDLTFSQVLFPELPKTHLLSLTLTVSLSLFLLKSVTLTLLSSEPVWRAVMLGSSFTWLKYSTDTLSHPFTRSLCEHSVCQSRSLSQDLS